MFVHSPADAELWAAKLEVELSSSFARGTMSNVWYSIAGIEIIDTEFELAELVAIFQLIERNSLLSQVKQKKAMGRRL